MSYGMVPTRDILDAEIVDGESDRRVGDEPLPFERVERWGYELVVTVQGTRHEDLRDVPVSVNLYRCPKCSATVTADAGGWSRDYRYEHIDWHEGRA